MPLEVADLRGPQSVTVGDQDHGRVSISVAAVLAGIVHELFDLAARQLISHHDFLVRQQFHQVAGQLFS